MGIPENTTVINSTEAVSFVTANFDLFVETVQKTMPRREFLSLPGKDDVYMRCLGKMYAQVRGINSITLVGPEVRNVLDYMDVLYTAQGLYKRGALQRFELDCSEDGKPSLNIKR